MKAARPRRARSQRAEREPAGADSNALKRMEHAAQQGSAPDIPRMEWIVALIGVALVVFTIGWIIWRGLAREPGPPQVALQMKSVVEVGNGYLVHVQAINQGGRTAADVKVAGTLSNTTRQVETAEMTFKFLPPNSPRQGGLFFTNDPRTLRLELSAQGYEAP